MPKRYYPNGEEVTIAMGPKGVRVSLDEFEEYLREFMKLQYMKKKMMGYPVVYMNEAGEIVKDYLDGRIEVLHPGENQTDA